MQKIVSQLKPEAIAGTRLVVPVLLAVAAITFLAQGFLRESFWLDESITVWVTSESIGTAIERATRFQGQSPFYYLIVWGVRQLFELSEVSVRLVSVAFLLASVSLVFAVVARLHSRETALYSALFFIVHPGVLRALSARPYALALCMALAATWALVAWRQSARNAWLVSYALLLAATFYAHFLFSAIVLLHFVWIGCAKSAPVLRRFSVATITAALFCVPGLVQLASLFGRRHDLSFIPFPGAGTIFQSVLPLSLAVPLVGGILLAKISVPRAKLLLSGHQMALIVAGVWWMLGPLLFLVLAACGVASLFHDRYFLWAAVGLAFVLGLLIKGISPEPAKVRAFFLTLVLLIVAEGERRWQIEDWRSAATMVEAHADEPLLLSSGLIESSQVNWLEGDRETRQYLAAPLIAYQRGRQAVLLPYHGVTTSQIDYFSRVIVPALQDRESYLLLYLSPLQESVAQLLRDLHAHRGCKGELLLSGLVTLQRFTCAH